MDSGEGGEVRGGEGPIVDLFTVIGILRDDRVHQLRVAAAGPKYEERADRLLYDVGFDVV